MVQPNNRQFSHSRKKKGSNRLLILFIAALALLSVGLYYYLQKKPATSLLKSTGFVEDQLSPQKNWPAQDRMHRLEDVQKDQAITQANQDSPSSAIDELIDNHEENEDTFSRLQAEESLLGLNNNDTDTDIDTLEPGSQLIVKMNMFYTHLDQQPYIKDSELKEPSKVYFSKLLQKLADNPPVVVRETDNLVTLLHNTAHFFRILGKKNILLIKKIMAAESGSFEQNARVFYKLTGQPESLKKEYALTIPSSIMTDYAAFFLNTMGGRLYLFRRDSTTRMVVTFYAIMTIDRANIAGNSGHGIDLRPAISALTEEMENGGRRLQLKEQYLDVLYDLQEKYN